MVHHETALRGGEIQCGIPEFLLSRNRNGTATNGDKSYTIPRFLHEIHPIISHSPCPGEESGNQMNFHRFFLHIESPWQIEFQHHPQTTFAKEKQANSKLSGKLQNRPKTLPTTCDDDHPPCLKYANSDKFTERRNQTKKVPGMHPRRGTGQHGWARHGWPL